MRGVDLDDDQHVNDDGGDNHNFNDDGAMSFPVVPSDFEAVEPKIHGSLCDEITKLGQFDILLAAFMNFVTDGCSLSEEFKSMLCDNDCQTTTTTTTTCLFGEDEETTTSTTTEAVCDCTNFSSYPVVLPDGCEYFEYAPFDLCERIRNLPISTVEDPEWLCVAAEWGPCNGQAIVDYLEEHCGYSFVVEDGDSCPEGVCPYYARVMRLA